MTALGPGGREDSDAPVRWEQTAETKPRPGTGPDWQRLHPLTPLIAALRSVVLLVLVLAEDSRNRTAGVPITLIILGAITLLLLLVGLVRYAVTKWALDGATLRVETGLLRRDARQLPLARIQAVDVVRPFLARAFGLAEVRVRLAGSGRANGRLAYLSAPVALDLRARLLAGHHGLDQSTPEPAEQPLANVPPGRLVAAALLSPAAAIAVGLVIAVIALTSVSRAATAAVGGSLLVYALSFAHRTWRRVADQYGFSVGLAPDGLRVRRGLLSTVAETIPFARVQAVRKVQPLIWRPMGWCRLEVDVAGSAGREQGTRASRLTRALLPVGPTATADWMLSSALGLKQFELSKPPRRAAWKAPLSYHFLGSAYQGGVIGASKGRTKKTTTWMPLEKAQSIRWVEGPLQRSLHLATVRVDAAGRAVIADLRDRDSEEARRIFDSLLVASRSARHRVASKPPGPEATHGADASPAAPARPADGTAQRLGDGLPPSGPAYGHLPSGLTYGQPPAPPSELA